MELEKITKG